MSEPVKCECRRSFAKLGDSNRWWWFDSECRYVVGTLGAVAFCAFCGNRLTIRADGTPTADLMVKRAALEALAESWANAEGIDPDEWMRVALAAAEVGSDRD